MAQILTTTIVFFFLSVKGKKRSSSNVLKRDKRKPLKKLKVGGYAKNKNEKTKVIPDWHREGK